jgi:hypothetical protein
LLVLAIVAAYEHAQGVKVVELSGVGFLFEGLAECWRRDVTTT